jgi:ADP-ribosylglycohydrolase
MERMITLPHVTGGALIEVVVTRVPCVSGVAFLGLGAMGRPMAGRLLDARDRTSAQGSGDPERTGYEELRERHHDQFAQRIACDSRETVPAVFALATLAGGDLRAGVEFAANFGRDTDTIASMTGAICGAVGGAGPIPDGWIATLGPPAVSDAEELAGRLAETARSKVADSERGARSVPGLVDG